MPGENFHSPWHFFKPHLTSLESVLGVGRPAFMECPWRGSPDQRMQLVLLALVYNWGKDNFFDRWGTLLSTSWQFSLAKAAELDERLFQIDALSSSPPKGLRCPSVHLYWDEPSAKPWCSGSWKSLSDGETMTNAAIGLVAGSIFGGAHNNHSFKVSDGSKELKSQSSSANKWAKHSEYSVSKDSLPQITLEAVFLWD